VDKPTQFLNRRQLPLFCEKTGVTALVLPGLMAGWQEGRLAGRQAGRIK